jgi:preprotein translocase subunit SecF
VTGLLTVIGFSVHDSIVVFDRIRENVTLAPQARLHANVNAALLQTLARSLNTSFTLLFVVLAMLFLGGVTIRSFLLVILIGVIAGTYSSVGLAAQLLVAWDEGELGRWLRPWKRGSDEVVAPS